MATRFPSARHQAALGLPTGYRRWSRLTFSRQGLTRVLEPIAGNFTQDARRSARWDGRLSFVGDDLIPQSPRDLLTPFGTVVEVELGLELLDGSVSSVPFGTFQISSCRTRVQAGARTIDIGLSDISQRVNRYRFESPFTVTAATDLGQMVNRVITNRLGLSPSVSSAGQALGVARVFGLSPSEGPWEEILDVLKSFSRTAWYDRVGRVRLGSTTIDPSTSYPLSSLVSLSADFDEQPPNVIVARGESTDDKVPPVQAVAIDTDPSSPTYAGVGPAASAYGRVTEFYSSPLILNAPQAQAAANTLLAGRIGAGATYTLACPYDPTIDATDVVSAGGSVYVVDSVSVDLDGDTSMQVREIA
jgi:hypothetical protein